MSKVSNKVKSLFKEKAALLGWNANLTQEWFLIHSSLASQEHLLLSTYEHAEDIFSVVLTGVCRFLLRVKISRLCHFLP